VIGFFDRLLCSGKKRVECTVVFLKQLQECWGVKELLEIVERAGPVERGCGFGLDVFGQLSLDVLIVVEHPGSFGGVLLFEARGLAVPVCICDDGCETIEVDAESGGD
jgi:hypothetical protein